MTSSTKNVKIGVCRASYKGVDLGFTKGGVEVSVSSDTHEVTVDQYGSTPISERITGRKITVTCPLAETTLENMVAVMPGAVLSTNGAFATSVATFPSANLEAGDTISVNGRVITARALPATALEFQLGATAAATAANFAAFLASATDVSLRVLTAHVDATNALEVTISYGLRSILGNGVPVSSAVTGLTFSSATLTGGVNVTAARVDVPSGVGIDLLETAGPLILHPIALPANDRSEDLVIPVAATAGAMQFSYQTDSERVYNVEFKGYPDENANSRLFGFGDPNA